MTWRLAYQGRVSKAGKSIYIPQLLWDVITCPWLNTDLYHVIYTWIRFALSLLHQFVTDPFGSDGLLEDGSKGITAVLN